MRIPYSDSRPMGAALLKKHSHTKHMTNTGLRQRRNQPHSKINILLINERTMTKHFMGISCASRAWIDHVLVITRDVGVRCKHVGAIWHLLHWLESTSILKISRTAMVSVRHLDWLRVCSLQSALSVALMGHFFNFNFGLNSYTYLNWLSFWQTHRDLPRHSPTSAKPGWGTEQYIAPHSLIVS